MPDSRFVTVNGLKLHYLDFGNPSAAPLICVHGLTGNAHNFDAVAQRLASRYHVMSLDVRGRGDSDWGPSCEYDAIHYASDLGAMIDQLGLGQVALVGTSMGGIISMTFAGTNPNRVTRVVLNDIGPEIDPVGLRRISAYVGESPSEFRDMNAVAVYYRENYPPMAKMAPALLEEFIKWAVKPTPRGTLEWKMDPAVRQPMRAGTGGPVLDLWQLYRRITVPVLLVRGQESDVLSAITAKKMCEPPVGARLVEVSGVGHAPSLSEPECIRALDEFLVARR
jgi:esterase